MNLFHSRVNQPVIFRAIVTALVAQLLSFIMFSPALWLPMNGRFTTLYEPLSRQPWSKEIAAESQVRHRILGPVIAHYLGMQGVASASIPVLGGTLMLIFSFLAVRRETNDQWAVWATFLIASTQTFISSQTWLGYQDALGGAAIAACFLTHRPWLGALCLFLGMLAEERCAAAIPFIVVWHFDNGIPHRWKRALYWSICLSAAFACWVAFYFFARSHFLPIEQSLNHDMGGTSFRLMKENISFLAMGFFQSIRGGWIVIGYALFLMWTRKKYLLALVCVFSIVACLGQAGVVSDISRSASVIWPVLIIAVRELARQPSDHSLTILKVAVWLNFLSPCYQVMGHVVSYLYPLPISLFRWFAGA